MPTPERTTLPGGPEIARVVCGLWQVADIEKDGSDSSIPERGADALAGYVARRLRHASTWPTTTAAPSLSRARLLARHPVGPAAGCHDEMVP